MPRIAAIPAASRKTLLEWIEHDDGDTTGPNLPPCNPQTGELHAKLCAPIDDARRRRERLQPPPGMPLAPLG